MKQILTLEDFLDFCRQQGNARYNYRSLEDCAVGMYCRARLGAAAYEKMGYSEATARLGVDSARDIRVLARWPWTFSALAERLEELQQ